jgi:diguanylate cyclase (GGDEF)-like protein
VTSVREEVKMADVVSMNDTSTADRIAELEAQLKAKDETIDGLLTALETARRLSVTDELTGALNKRGADEALRAEISRSGRGRAPLCVAVLDVDNFKLFNDTKGHLAGDRLLRSAVDAWKEQLRPYDVLGRWGGDEFVIVLPDTHRDEARRVLKRVLRATPMGQIASAGVVERLADERPEDTLERADSDLYVHKRRKRALRPVDNLTSVSQS